MATYPDIAREVVQVDGNRLNFSLNGLDYNFVFDPNTDVPEEGATLTYVGDNDRGRLSPSEFAAPESWRIAALMFGLPNSSEVEL